MKGNDIHVERKREKESEKKYKVFHLASELVELGSVAQRSVALPQ